MNWIFLSKKLKKTFDSVLQDRDGNRRWNFSQRNWAISTGLRHQSEQFRSGIDNFHAGTNTFPVLRYSVTWKTFQVRCNCNKFQTICLWNLAIYEKKSPIFNNQIRRYIQFNSLVKFNLKDRILTSFPYSPDTKSKNKMKIAKCVRESRN